MNSYIDLDTRQNRFELNLKFKFTGSFHIKYVKSGEKLIKHTHFN